MDHPLVLNPDAEFRSSERVLDVPLYRSCSTGLRFRIRHCHPPYIPDLARPPSSDVQLFLSFKKPLKAICSRRRREASSLFPATNTWHWSILRHDTSIFATVRRMSVATTWKCLMWLLMHVSLTCKRTYSEVAAVSRLRTLRSKHHG
jgi:hypothetical protein